MLYVDKETKALILFNPWTQTRHTIKTSLPRYFLYGFGYDKSEDTYVILLINCKNNNGFTWSSNTRNWVPLPSATTASLNLDDLYNCVGFCVNECIYWRMRKSGILCFDLKTCKFNLIQRPPKSPGSRRYLGLVSFGDRLAADEYIRDSCTNVWELDGETIPKLISSAASERGGVVFYEFMSPVLRLKNGEVILVSNVVSHSGEWYGHMMREERKIYLYNEERKSLTRLKSPGVRSIRCSDTMICYDYNLFTGGGM